MDNEITTFVHTAESAEDLGLYDLDHKNGHVIFLEIVGTAGIAWVVTVVVIFVYFNLTRPKNGQVNKSAI